MDKIKRYMSTDYKFDKITMAAIFSMLWAIAGVYGFIYEVIFYYLNGGMKYVYWRGGCFGPWITIYGIGSILIYFLTYRFKRKPLLVFLVGGLGCGAFEFIAGVILYYCCDHHRGWDYDTERWNFGNIGGFICLRSVLIFAVSSLLLIYFILPLIFFLQKKMSKKAFLILAFTLGGLFVLDDVYNLVIAPRCPDFISANAFYEGLGLHTLEYY